MDPNSCTNPRSQEPVPPGVRLLFSLCALVAVSQSPDIDILLRVSSVIFWIEQNLSDCSQDRPSVVQISGTRNFGKATTEALRYPDPFKSSGQMQSPLPDVQHIAILTPRVITHSSPRMSTSSLPGPIADKVKGEKIRASLDRSAISRQHYDLILRPIETDCLAIDVECAEHVGLRLEKPEGNSDGWA